MTPNTSNMKLVLAPGLVQDAITQALAVGKLVGAREAKRGNLFLVAGEEGALIQTTLDQAVPGFYSICLGSVRWSVTQDQYVEVVNAFLGDETVLHPTEEAFPERGIKAGDLLMNVLRDALTDGLKEGIEAYNATLPSLSNPGETDADALLARGLFLNLDQGSTAWYADRADAEKWALLQSNGDDYPWSVTLVTPGQIMEEAELTLDEVQAKLGDAKTLWRAWVSSTPVE